MSKFEEYLEAVRSVVESEDRKKRTGEIYFKNIQEIKDFIEKYYSKLSVKIPFRVWTRLDGRKWKDPNEIYGEKEDIVKFYNQLNSIGKEMQVKGPHGSDPLKPAIKVGNFIFNKISDGTIEFIGKDRLEKNSNVWK